MEAIEIIVEMLKLETDNSLPDNSETLEMFNLNFMVEVRGDE